jgi:preprotein translocase subunit SecE
MSKVVSKETVKSLPGMAFLREAKAELKKVTWPGKTQIWYSTLIVIAFTLGVSIYLGFLDFLLTWLFGIFTQGS